MKTMIALVALCLVLFSVSVYADGMIIPEPMPPHPHPDMLEVKYHHVNVSINNQFTETQIDQVFHNPNSWDIEGTYLFPLPEGASIQKFSMYVDGKELQGEVLDASEARSTYEDLVRKMIDPGLLEYVDRNTFKARVYPIEKNSDKRVKLDYSEVISCESGICEYTYPLNTEKFSSKNLESVVVNVMIKSNVAIKNVYSPSHNMEIKRISDYEVQVSYEAKDVKPDTDFKLIYTLSGDDIGINVMTHKDGDTGYFLLMLAPKVAMDQLPQNKDIVFVLDKSGSMAGEKIDEAREALKFCLNNLNPDDKFGIVTFSTGVNSYRGEMETATSENIKAAVSFASQIEALGGTDIDSALLEAMKMLPSDNNPKIIIFLTDGEPTVGVTDISQIIKDITTENTAGAKLFIFGVGYDVNTHLLDKLSLDNHGTSEYVVEGENIEIKVSNFYEKVQNPVLSDVSVTITDTKVFISDFDVSVTITDTNAFQGWGTSTLSVMEMYPKELPDIFKGTQLLVFGQYKGSGEAVIELKGEINAVVNIVGYTGEFPDSESDNDFLPRLWATRKIGYLLDEIRLEGENDELVNEVITLSKRYGIATPYTSFLILEDEPVASAGHRLGEAFAPTSGAGAVDTSQNIGSYKSAQSSGGAEQTISGPGGETMIKYVGSKTFIEKNGIMTDTDYVDGNATKNLKYGSQAYFNALANNPQLGQYFAVGKNVIVCTGSTCIKVSEEYNGVEDAIPAMGQAASVEKQCSVDPDCKLDACSCTCMNKDVFAECEIAKDCPNEVGVSGCVCANGVCAVVANPNWRPLLQGGIPTEQQAECGNGICESGEGTSSCPADCKANVKVSKEEKIGELEILIAAVIVLIAAVMAVRFWHYKKSK